MGFKLTKTFKFEAAHRLPHHDGHCARPHGHSWLARIVCEGAELHKHGAKQGMLVDFADISKVLKPILDNYLDHYELSATTGLANPTSEELARWLYNLLKPQLPQLAAVQIEETSTSACEYRPDTK